MLLTHKLDNKEQKRVRDFDKTFLVPSYEYFSRSTQETFVGKYMLFNETQTESFLENRGHSYLAFE